MATIDTLVVNLVARHKRFVDGITKSTRSLTKLTSTASIVGGSMLGLAGGITAVNLATSGMNRGISRALGFQQAMANSTAIMTGLTDDMLSKMKEAAIQIPRYTKFSAIDGADSYFYLASAGLDAQQSIAALPQVAKFAQAGNFDLARATDLATDAQSALGLTVNDSAQNLKNLTRVTDVLIKSNTLANATAEQFSLTLTSGLGAALRNANKDIEEGGSLMAVMADQGTKAEKAGTALEVVMRELDRRARSNADAFKAAGIEVFNAGGNWNNMADIIQDLEERLDGLSSRDASSVLSGLGFDAEATKFIKMLLGTSDKLREYEAALRDAGGTTEEIAMKQLAPMTRATSRLSAGFDKLAINALTPTLNSVADSLTVVGDEMYDMNVNGEKVHTFLNLITQDFQKMIGPADKVGENLSKFGSDFAKVWLDAEIAAQDFQIQMQRAALWANKDLRKSSLIETIFGELNDASKNGELEAMIERRNELFDARASFGEAGFAKAMGDNLTFFTTKLSEATAKTDELAESTAKLQKTFADDLAHDTELDRLKSLKERLEDSLMTPLEKFYLELDDIAKLMNERLITDDTFNRAIEDARKRLEDATGSFSALETPGSNAAVRVGSEAAFNAQDRYRNATALQQQQNKAFKQRDQTNKELKAINRSIKDSGKAQYAYVSLV